MKHDLKGYRKYHETQAENAAPGHSSAEKHSSDIPMQRDGFPAEDHKDYIYDPGQDSGIPPIMGNMCCDEEGLDLLGMESESACMSHEEICKRCKELEDLHLRTLADMDNFKKRLAREKEEQARYAAENVLADLLPALDNLELALTYGRGNPACADLVTGLDLAQKSLLETLARHGLTTVGSAGEAFNPEIHEALTQEANPNVPAGHVSQLFQKGYSLKGRLLRPAKVIVSAG